MILYFLDYILPLKKGISYGISAIILGYFTFSHPITMYTTTMLKICAAESCYFLITRKI